MQGAGSAAGLRAEKAARDGMQIQLGEQTVRWCI